VSEIAFSEILELKNRRYAWFGAVRNAEFLHQVHPFNRLMDEQGKLTNL
jgi:hypothetical protein